MQRNIKDLGRVVQGGFRRKCARMRIVIFDASGGSGLDCARPMPNLTGLEEEALGSVPAVPSRAVHSP